MDRFLRPAATLADDHRGRRRDVRETIRATLVRVNALQRELNAFATIDAAGATARATTIEREIAEGRDPGPLAGVPISVKDILDVASLPTRWGSLLMANAPPAKSDVAAVARLRAAGAVIIGKTTTTEFAHSPLAVSPLTGITRKSVGPRTDLRRLFGRCRRLGCGRPHPNRARHRRRMLDPASCRLHRRFRTQANVVLRAPRSGTGSFRQFYPSRTDRR
jgi:Amidase